MSMSDEFNKGMAQICKGTTLVLHYDSDTNTFDIAMSALTSEGRRLYEKLYCMDTLFIDNNARRLCVKQLVRECERLGIDTRRPTLPHRTRPKKQLLTLLRSRVQGCQK